MPTASAELSPAIRDDLAAMAARLRHHSLTSTHAAGSGHPTSCLSCAELMAGLFFHALHYDVGHPEHPGNDRFILSKGHAAPILWAALAEAGAFPVEELQTLRQIDSPLEGHPTPRCPHVDIATGSLGQGLSSGVGMAWYQRLRGIASRVWVLLGDGETAEGSVWEAAELASHLGLANLTAIVDVNALGQTGRTMLGHDLDTYRRRFESFGWTATAIDGHDIEAVVDAYAAAGRSEGPSVILARTEKGKGVSFLAGEDDRHGKPVSDDELDRALGEVGLPERPEGLAVAKPEAEVPPAPEPPEGDLVPEPSYQDDTATRDGYGHALAFLAEHDRRVVAFDGEVSNSTRSGKAGDALDGRFVEAYIAEQNMLGMAMGSAALGAIPYTSSFASFLTRAYDQIRMAAVSDLHLVLAGSHAGISIGEDGPSQMGLEDMAMLRAVPGSSVLCPADAYCAQHLTVAACNHPGIVYLRLARPDTPLIYGVDDRFMIGGSRVLRTSDQDAATVVACGVCVDQALKAADALIDRGVGLRVIDAYSVKPLDRDTVRAAAEETGKLVVVEDHYAEGGLGDAVAQAVAGIGCAFRHLAVRELPRSGDQAALMEHAGIDAGGIRSTVESLLD